MVEEKERQKETRGGQVPPFKGEHSECAQEVLLVAAAEDVSCPDLKGRSVQMPEY